MINKLHLFGCSHSDTFHCLNLDEISVAKVRKGQFWGKLLAYDLGSVSYTHLDAADE